ncbi:MAG: ribonuclease PH, partial [Alphaproteobacteria bacterium]|nr:ribonuclease PH [Alphaproteobacteria bacterium]
ALHRAFQRCVDLGVLKSIPLKDHAAAVSCGIYNGVPVLDLDYAEDSNAEADANFVFNGAGEIIEIQGTAEADPFSRAAFGELMDLADKGIGELVQAQKKALGIE